MSMNLHSLAPKRDNVKRLGRGPGSKGKTSGRGQKGAGARSGAKRRLTYEGGQFRLFQKLPTRGFTRGRFQKKLDVINLYQIDQIFEDGEVVNVDTLKEHGFLSNGSHGLKVLGEGELTKKVSIEAKLYSKSAQEKLEKAQITFTQK
jgi:large subunit ribosomal protein L15